MEMKHLFNAVLKGDAEGVLEHVKSLIDSGILADNILQDGLIKAMGEVGKRFEEGEFFVPEMLIAARAMQGGLGLLKPYLAAEDVKSSGKIIIGTVQGDLHDIGKNLVGMMLEGAGFEVIDLGVDVKPEELIDAMVESEPDIVCLSALLTTTMQNMEKAIEMMKDAGVLKNTKVMVGGAPVTQEYADEIGAHGFAKDASQATSVAKNLVM